MWPGIRRGFNGFMIVVYLLCSVALLAFPVIKWLSPQMRLGLSVLLFVYAVYRFYLFLKDIRISHNEK